MCFLHVAPIHEHARYDMICMYMLVWTIHSTQVECQLFTLLNLAIALVNLEPPLRPAACLSPTQDAVSKIAIPHSDGRLLASCGRQDMEAGQPSWHSQRPVGNGGWGGHPTNSEVIMTTVVVTSNYYISNYIFKNASRMLQECWGCWGLKWNNVKMWKCFACAQRISKDSVTLSRPGSAGAALVFGKAWEWWWGEWLWWHGRPAGRCITCQKHPKASKSNHRNHRSI